MERRNGSKIFSAIGVATGLGNAFRFPALYARFGTAFIIAYALTLALVGYPLLYAELEFGRKTVEKRQGKLITFIFRMAVANSAIIATYYGVICCKLGSACLNFALFEKAEGQGVITIISAVLIFSLALIILVKGQVALNVSGKVSVSCSVAVVAFLAFNGLKNGEILADFSALLCGEVWVEAVGQTLLSLSLAGGVMPTFARTLAKNCKTWAVALKIVLANFAGCLIVLFALLPFCKDRAVAGGIACAFTVYPQVVFDIAKGGILCSALGFCVYGTLTAVGLHSLCSLAYPLISVLRAKLKLTPLIFCIISALLAPVFALNDCQILNACDMTACCVTAVILAFSESLIFAKLRHSMGAINIFAKFLCPILCGITALLSVCSVRFSYLSTTSVAFAVLTALTPLFYALIPTFPTLLKGYKKRRQN